MIKSCCDPHLFTNMVTGIDCSKDYFDISVSKDQRVVFQGRFSNDSIGFEQALEHVFGSHIAMEATGPYYFQLARFFHEQGQKVSVLNPLVVRRFSQMQLSRAKTDKKDAVLIAKFTAMTNPKEWVMPTNEILQIRNLETYLEGLKQRKGMLYNQFHAFEAAATIEVGLKEEIKKDLDVYDKKIAEKEKEIETLIARNYTKLLQNLKSIPGIGPRSASLLIVLTDGVLIFS